MELATKNITPTTTTPSKHHHQSVSPHAENLNPNLSRNNTTTPSSLKQQSKSPKNSNNNNKHNHPVVIIRSPQNRIRQRKFLVAKKKNNNNSKTVSCKCKDKGEAAKCLCVAYQNLRASQEEFFNNKQEAKACDDNEEEKEEEEEAENAFIEASLMIQDLRIDGEANEEGGKLNNEDEEGSSSACVKRRRDKLLEEARNSVPETGSGRVMHLVKAFEKLLSMPKSKKEQKEEEEEEEEGDEKNKENDHGHGLGEGNGKNKSKVMKWALPGLQFDEPPNAPETEVSGSASSSLLCASDLVLTSENLGLDSRISVSSSWDSSRGSYAEKCCQHSQNCRCCYGAVTKGTTMPSVNTAIAVADGNLNVSSRTSSGGRRSRRNSLESCSTFGGRRCKKKQQLKVTSQKPFKLRTEQRGKLKEEEFMKKMQEMMTEEQKMRIPIAQGLPWTTDEPECLVKPPVKESTRPIDLKLHSDVRAIDRAEFDHQVAEKMSFVEQLKLERERQQKLAEEEEIRRLRKELIPKAQPMPYFDRPFVPRRSMKHPTMPREPKFHIPQHKKIKCCLSWNAMNPYSSYQN